MDCNNVILQNPVTYEIIYQFSIQNKNIIHMAFSPNGQSLATVSYDGKAKIIFFDQNKTEIMLDKHDQAIYSVCFSQDGSKIATCSVDKTAIVWNVQTGDIDNIFIKHKDTINCLVFSPDGKVLGTAGKEAICYIWDIEKGTIKITLKGHKDSINCICYSPDGCWIGTSSDDHDAIVWNAITGEIDRVFQLHSLGVLCIQFSPNGKQIVTSSYDNKIIIWNLNVRSFGYFYELIQLCKQENLQSTIEIQKKFQISGIYGLNLLQFVIIKKDQQLIKIVLGYLIKQKIYVHICNVQYQEYILESIDIKKDFQTLIMSYYITVQEIQCINCLNALKKSLQKFQIRATNKDDLFLFLQFAIVIKDQISIKDIVDQLLKIKVSVHLCQFQFFNCILNYFQYINNENQRKFIDLIVNFNQDQYCYDCITPQNKLILYFTKSKLDLKRLLDSLFITEKQSHLAKIFDGQEFYLKIQKYGDQKIKNHFDQIIKSNNNSTQNEQSITNFKNHCLSLIGKKQYYLKHRGKIKQQSCYFHFLRIQNPVNLVNQIQQHYKSSDCEIYQSIALKHLINSQYEEYGKNEYSNEAVFSICSTLIFILNIFLYQSDKNSAFFLQQTIKEDIKIQSTILDLICIQFAFFLIKREYQEYYLQKLDGKSYFNDGWNYFDLIGISSQFGSCITDIYSTFFPQYFNTLKRLNASFCIAGIFFQTIACIKYLRIMNKFSSLIQLLQKVLVDMKFIFINLRYFLLLLVIIYFDFFLVFYMYQAYHFNGVQYNRFKVLRMTFLILLGQFSNYLTIDEFDDPPKGEKDLSTQPVSFLIFFTFAIAAFLLQVVLMNLLISIIGDTFGKVQGQAFQDQVFERIDIMTRINRKLAKKDDNKFITLVNTQRELLIKEDGKDDQQKFKDEIEDIQDKLDDINNNTLFLKFSRKLLFINVYFIIFRIINQKITQKQFFY